MTGWASLDHDLEIGLWFFAIDAVPGSLAVLALILELRPDSRMRAGGGGALRGMTRCLRELGAGHRPR